MKLVARTAVPHTQRAGATGWFADWSGSLGILLDAGEVVWPGIELSSRSRADYSSTYADTQRVELVACDGAWLVSVISIASEGCVPDVETLGERWLGSVDGRTWRRLAPHETIPAGAVVDTLTTPPAASRAWDAP